MEILAKESFVFYKSFYEAIKKLGKKDQLTLYSYICRYSFGEKVEELEGVPAAIFDLIKPQIDANIRRYENGLKGGRPKSRTKPSNNQTETKPERNVNENVNVNENENVNVNVNVNAPDEPADTDNTHASNRPSPVKIIMAFDAKGYKLGDGELERFIKYNDEKGWKLSIEAAADTWIANANKKPPSTGNNFLKFEQHNYDFDSIERQLMQLQQKEAEDYEQRNMG